MGRHACAPTQHIHGRGPARVFHHYGHGFVCARKCDVDAMDNVHACALQGRVVENISKRCGGFLRSLGLRGCISVEDAALQ